MLGEVSKPTEHQEVVLEVVVLRERMEPRQLEVKADIKMNACFTNLMQSCF